MAKKVIQMTDDFYFSKESGKLERKKWKSIQECMKHCDLKCIRYNNITNDWVIYFRNRENKILTIWWTKTIYKCIINKYKELRPR